MWIPPGINDGSWLIPKGRINDLHNRSLFLGNAAGTLQHAGDVWFQEYEHGRIYFHHGDQEAFEVHGAILDRYKALDAHNGYLAYPQSNETTPPDNFGRYNKFQNGYIYWTPRTAVHDIGNPVFAVWKTLNWENGYLGYPISDYADGADGSKFAIFEGGSIYVKGTANWIVPQQVVHESGPIPNSAPFACSVKLTLLASGSFVYSGHAHGSGFMSQHFQVASILTLPDGRVVGTAKSGQVGGSTSGGDRTFDWQDAGFNSVIRDKWRDIKGAGMQTNLRVATTVNAHIFRERQHVICE